MQIKQDNRVAQLITNIGSLLVSQYTPPPNIRQWAEIALYLLPPQLSTSPYPQHKGIGILGNNGNGKSLHARILFGYIAAYYGKHFIMARAKGITKVGILSITTLLNAGVKDLYIDDMGYDDRSQSYGNKIDLIADLIEDIDVRNEKQAEKIRLHFTSNLDCAGYATMCDRYGKRIADRIQATTSVVEVPSFDSMRGETELLPTTPEKEQQINALLKAFTLNVLGVDVATTLLPHEQAKCEKNIASLRCTYQIIRDSEETSNLEAIYAHFQGAMAFIDQSLSQIAESGSTRLNAYKNKMLAAREHIKHEYYKKIPNQTQNKSVGDIVKTITDKMSHRPTDTRKTAAQKLREQYRSNPEYVAAMQEYAEQLMQTGGWEE